jgi:hypothetical protein
VHVGFFVENRISLGFLDSCVAVWIPGLHAFEVFGQLGVGGFEVLRAYCL